MPDPAFRRALLFDIYGPLLTDKQREYFDLHYNEDYSLSEIAEETGISRQGVWDQISRAEKAMEEMESKTGLVEKYMEQDRIITEIRKQLDVIRKETGPETEQAIGSIEEKLGLLKG